MVGKTTALVASAALFLVLGGGAGYLVGRGTSKTPPPSGPIARDTEVGTAAVTRGDRPLLSGSTARSTPSERTDKGSSSDTGDSAAAVGRRSVGAAATADAASPSSAGVDWSEFGRALAKNLEALDRIWAAAESNEKAARAGREVAPMSGSDTAAAMEVYAAFNRANAAAKAIAKRPGLDERFLPGFVSAIYGESLGLSAKRRTALEQATRDALRDTLRAIDPESAAPVALFAARRALATRIADATKTDAPAEVVARRQKLLPLAAKMLDGDHTLVRIGASDPAKATDAVLDAWEEAYGLDLSQRDALRSTAGRYVTDATEILRRYDLLDGSKTTAPAVRASAEAEMLPLLLVAERDVESRLSYPQREAAQARPPTVVVLQGGDEEIITTEGGGL